MEVNQARLLDLHRRMQKIERVVASWDKRLKSLDYNLTHYVNKRLPQRNRQADLTRKALRIVSSFEKVLNGRRLRTTYTNGKAEHFIFMCTANQAAKLRGLAELDLRLGHAWRQLDKGGSNGYERTRPGGGQALPKEGS